MFKKNILFYFLFGSLFFQNLLANEKELIIEKLRKIENLTFNFEQIINNKKEIGVCFLVFNNKLKCQYYEDNKEKEILVNGKTLVVMQKRYNKNYFYPLSKSPFSNILNKESLISFIKEAKMELNENIDLVYLDKEEQKITIYFNKNSFDLLGWKIEDKLQNNIFFSLKIKNVNKKYNDKIFLIPKAID